MGRKLLVPSSRKPAPYEEATTTTDCQQNSPQQQDRTQWARWLSLRGDSLTRGRAPSLCGSLESNSCYQILRRPDCRILRIVRQLLALVDATGRRLFDSFAPNDNFLPAGTSG